MLQDCDEQLHRFPGLHLLLFPHYIIIDDDCPCSRIVTSSYTDFQDYTYYFVPTFANYLQQPSMLQECNEQLHRFPGLHLVPAFANY